MYLRYFRTMQLSCTQHGYLAPLRAEARAGLADRADAAGAFARIVWPRSSASCTFLSSSAASRAVRRSHVAYSKSAVCAGCDAARMWASMTLRPSSSTLRSFAAYRTLPTTGSGSAKREPKQPERQCVSHRARQPRVLR